MEHSKLVGAVSNCAVSTDHGIYAVRLKTAPTTNATGVAMWFIIVDFRINGTLQIGRRCFQLRRFNRPRHLCGAVENRTYREAKVSLYFLNSL